MKTRSPGFTLVEMLVVMTIIAILAGLVLMGYGYAQRSSAERRAATEIAAMETALESYRADNAIYPKPASQAKPTTGTPTTAAAKALYQALSGDGNSALGGDEDSDGSTDAGAKRYVEFKPNQLGGLNASDKVTANTYVMDPFGSPYGYYVPDSSDPATIAKNPTFDMWSTAGAPAVPARWITNW